MKLSNTKVKQILNKGVAVGNLSELLIKKFMNFLQSQISEEVSSLVPLSVQKREDRERGASEKQQE